MIRPKRLSTIPAAKDCSLPADNYLYLDGRTIASPAFRILLWCDGSWRDTANHLAMLAIYDAFCDRWGDQICSLTRPDVKGRSRRTSATSWLIEAARNDLTSPAPDAPVCLRIAGWSDDPHFIESAPCLRLGEIGNLAYLTLELPHRADDLVAFSDQVTRQVAGMALRCGVAGFGFFLPDYLESLIFALPMSTKRLLTAIELTPSSVASCILPDLLCADGDDAPQMPGLADIGWRTFIGAPFWDRLPDLSVLETANGVGIKRQGDIIAITAGETPIWGLASWGDELEPYRRVAEALRALRIQTGIADRYFYGADMCEPERTQRVRNYLCRFDNEAL